MWFDAVLGNPPYQGQPTNSGYAPPIYHRFYDAALNLSDRVALIMPARFLFNAGGTPKAWNDKMLQDPHLRVVLYESNSSNAFPDVFLEGGVSILYRDVATTPGPIGTFVPFPELSSILEKVSQLTPPEVWQISSCQERPANSRTCFLQRGSLQDLAAAKLRTGPSRSCRDCS